MSSETLVCPSCLALNRVPAERLREGPQCGKCKAALVSDHPVEATSEGLAKMIARSTLPVVVDFWAPWCGPCRMMAPAFQSAAEQLEPAVRLIKLNSDEQQQIAGQLGIRSIPTMILFHHGREVARQSGAMAAGQIVQWARQAAAKAA